MAGETVITIIGNLNPEAKQGRDRQARPVAAAPARASVPADDWGSFDEAPF